MSTAVFQPRCVVLGCGTSTGVPLIGCKCPICQSCDPRNKRLRSSIWLDFGEKTLLIDAGSDLRQQALTNGLRRVDSVLFTHTHADHVHGMDDLRMFNFLQLSSISCFGTQSTLEQLRERFAYIFNPHKSYPSALPQLKLELLPDQLPYAQGIIQSIPIFHGREAIVGFRFGSLAYLTDVSQIPEESLKLLTGVEQLIIGALRDNPHPTHFTIGQALEAIETVGAKRAYLTHMSHHLDYASLNQRLPDHVEPCYDGQVICFNYP